MLTEINKLTITFNDGNHKVNITIYEEGDESKISIDWSDCPEDYESKMIGMVNWFVKTITQ